MRLRNILLVVGVLALLSGLVFSGIWIAQPPGSSVTSGSAPVKQGAILVATHQIRTGLLLRAEDMRWKEVASSDVLTGYLARGRDSEASYVGAVARRDFSEGEPLVATALVKPQERGFLAAVLAPNMRAVTITVSAQQSFAGLLLPGDRVDIILTQRFNDAATNPAHQIVGETVLHDLRLIAVDQKMSGTSSSPARLSTTSGDTPKTITLEVSELDAEKLLVAAELGNVAIALRPLEDSGTAATSGISAVWASDVSPALGTLGQGPSIGVATENDQWSGAPVQVIHGAKIDGR